uniref:Copper-containing nitrite reductase n=1 Tax=Globodera pallida TaxID=36090 RepID=A0A183CSH9_GLOPA
GIERYGNRTVALVQQCARRRRFHRAEHNDTGGQFARACASPRAARMRARFLKPTAIRCCRKGLNILLIKRTELGLVGFTL